MPLYLVENSTFKKTFQGRGGDMKVYTVTLKDGEQSVDAELIQQPSTPEPYAGQTLDGTISDGPYGKKFQKTKKDSFGKRDPKESASIVRQHSQHMAIIWSAILDRRGKLSDDQTSPEGLKKLIDWFMLDAQNGSDRQPT